MTPRATVIKAGPGLYYGQAPGLYYGQHADECEARTAIVYNPWHRIYECRECHARFAPERPQEPPPMPVTKANLVDTMSYHPLDAEQQAAYTRIQDAAIAFAAVALDVLPACGDQQAAIRLIFEAKATLNRGVAVRGLI